MTKDEALTLALAYIRMCELDQNDMLVITDMEEALAQPEGRNFCPRCGKRTADLTTIHTCTPPASQITDSVTQGAAPQQKPVTFLVEGTRFKLGFRGNGVVDCFAHFEPELDGRWVALVAAEDDCHLKVTAPPRAQPEPLTGEQIDKVWAGLDYTQPFKQFRVAVGRAFEAAIKGQP